MGFRIIYKFSVDNFELFLSILSAALVIIYTFITTDPFVLHMWLMLSLVGITICEFQNSKLIIDENT